MTLYIVATPIGNLSDISARACEILKSVDLILAEDTRTSKKLLQYLQINKPMLAVHKFNETRIIPKILSLLETKDLALISDAGTPLISDPGFQLVQTVKQHKINVVPIPGACALIAALSASGLTTDNFIFYGFLPNTSSKRLKQLESLKFINNTMIFYESPKRIIKTIDAMLIVFGDDRLCCIAREITKLNEEIITLTLGEINFLLHNDNITLKGEFVVVIEANKEPINQDKAEVNRIFKILSNELSSKQAIKLTSKITKINKNKIYQLSLENK